MKNKKKLINQIIYRSTHRGTKEMDILLGGFVKKYINKLDDDELIELDKILNYEDEVLYKFYFNKSDYKKANDDSKFIKMLKEFKI